MIAEAARLRREVVSQPGFLDGPVPEWESLVARSARASVFQTPAWVQAWWSVYGGIRRPAVLTVRDGDGELLGLATMMVERRHRLLGPAHLGFIGSWASGEHHLLVEAGREAELAPILYRGMLEAGGRWGSVEILTMPDPWPALMGVRQGPAPKSLDLQNSCPVVTLPASWEEYLQGLPGKERHELKRKLRRAEQAGLRHRVVSGGPTLDRDLDQLLALNLKRWGRQGLWAPGRLSYRRKLTFLRRAVRALAADGRLRLHLLERDGRTVSGVLCFEHGSTSYAYLTGFDAAHAGSSPGLAVFAAAIRAAIQSGRTRFNFICGQHDYKYRLGAADEPLWGWTEPAR